MKQTVKKAGYLGLSAAAFLAAYFMAIPVYYLMDWCVVSYMEKVQGIAVTEERYLQLITNSTYAVAGSIIISSILLMIMGLWYRRMRRKMGRGRKPLASLINGKILLTLVLLGVGMQYATNYFLMLIELLDPQRIQEYLEMFAVMEESAQEGILLPLLYSVVLAPVSEEFIFRGVILGQMRRALPFWAANVLQALLFGVYHGNLVQGAYAFCVGLFLGYISKKADSLIPAIAFHMIYNLFGSALTEVMPSYGGELIWGHIGQGLCTILLLAVGFWMLKKQWPDKHISGTEGIQ